MAVKRRGERASNIILGFAEGEQEFNERLIKSEVTVVGQKKTEEEKPSLVKSILNILNGPGQTVERLAFEFDPSQKNDFAGVYRAKLRLIPDSILKRIAIQDSLVATIVRARQNQVSAFGRPRGDRFSTGFVIEPNTGIADNLDEEGKKKLKLQLENAIKVLSSCGYTKGVKEEHQATFAEYLSLSVRSAIVVGRIATEVVWQDTLDGEKKFSHFVATDAGTILRATKDHTGQESIRKEAYHLLCSLTGKKLIQEKYDNNEYVWVQVIDGTPKQVFTSDEMKIYNFYAVPDVELGGYPVTPIDTVISAVTTHINITTHNKLYFQSGRATRGMLTFKSDDATPNVIHNIKQHFNASINNVNNAWRMPVFGHGTDEEIRWQPIDSGGGRDMEFQYLTDMNAREILSAFMMSPDELPGWAYLSRGTNNQALSEGNNEYKLEAARDLGIRPILTQFEDFINSHLLPLIDEDLSEKARVRLTGLDSDNAEKEAVRIQQDAGIWMTFDNILERVEKKPVGKEWGGSIPLNQVYKSILDQYYTVGQILEHFCGVKDASKDPGLAYRRDPFFFQWLQVQQAQQQMQQQAQMAAQQPQGPGGGPPQGGSSGQDNSSGPPSGDDSGKGAHAMGDVKTENQKTEESQSASASGTSDLARSIDQAYDLLNKSEDQLPPDKRKLLAQQRQTVKFFIRNWEDDAKETVKDILKIAEHHAPRKRG